MERFAIESPDSVANIDTDDDHMMVLLAAKGNIHEHDFLLRLHEEQGIENAAIVKSKSLGQR